jgi:hypothetical protein
MLSYAGAVRLGVAADRRVIADPEAIVDGFHQALEELTAEARRPDPRDRDLKAADEALTASSIHR